MNYVIITPVFNEEKYLDVYIKSIINQSSKPLEMVMVDDSSTDDSANIIKEYSSNHTWIKYVHHSSLASKQQGSKVVAAFRHGVLSLSNLDYNVISKIDADLELPPNYFKTIMNAFQEDRQLGIVGGQIMEFSDGKWIVIPQSYYEVRGALKSYSAECYRAMGGIKPYLGWDGLDIMTAWHQGWKTKYLKIGVKHFRPANNDYNITELNYEFGISNYTLGGNLILAIVRAIVKLFTKPYARNGISFMQGYIHAMMSKTPKIVSKELAKYINRFHWNRLLNLRRY
jgi:glycosyltransferase involved in cell wall biosynthesis